MYNASASEVQRLAQTAANYFTRTVRAAAPHASDLLQEASLAILQARQTFDAGFVNAKGEGESAESRFSTYAYRAACIACRRYLWRNKLPVQVPRSEAEKDLGITATPIGVPKRKAEGLNAPEGLDVPDATPSAFDKYAELQMAGRVEKLLKDAAEADRELRHGVQLAMSGEKPREYAARRKVPVGEVYSSTSRLKRTLKSTPAALQLWQEV